MDLRWHYCHVLQALSSWVYLDVPQGSLVTAPSVITSMSSFGLRPVDAWSWGLAAPWPGEPPYDRPTQLCRLSHRPRGAVEPRSHKCSILVPFSLGKSLPNMGHVSGGDPHVYVPLISRLRAPRSLYRDRLSVISSRPAGRVWLWVVCDSGEGGGGELQEPRHG